MSILNIFSKKQKEKGSKKPKEQKKDSIAVSDNHPPVILKSSFKEQGVLIKPYFSEKFTLLREEKNKYIFEVNERITKNEMKKLIENIYNVKALRINVLKAPQKTKRWKGKKAVQKGNKKMIVTLREGQKIELGI